ncbi:MAG: rRNA maturation RNase YbeY [Hyphomonadaceae bacterium]
MVVEALVADARWDGALGEAPERFAARVLAAASAAESRDGEVSIAFGDDAMLHALNFAHRGQDKATNVLSFPAAAPGDLLGDVALAYETLATEAQTQGKTFAAHAAHLLVHGFLHLLGYDHETDADAARMEARERAILADLGVADPYAADET